MQIHILAINFRIDDFDIYDRLDGEDNEAASQVEQQRMCVYGLKLQHYIIALQFEIYGNPINVFESGLH